jgi:signal transduction histidine kinase
MAVTTPGGLPWRVSMHPAAEAVVAFLASAVFFLLAGAARPVRHHLVLILVLGAVYLYVVILAAKRLGPLFGVPLAIAGGVAFDSFFIPPIREFGAADWQNWLVVAIYIAMGVLVGMLAAGSQQRAQASEEARGLLAREQAALRRVATLVARESPPETVFHAVAEEVAGLLGVGDTIMWRYEDDGTVTMVADWGNSHDAIIRAADDQVLLDGDNVITRVRQTGRPARMDGDETAAGSRGAAARKSVVRSAIGCPLHVDGRLWGVVIAASQTELMPADSDSRIGQFTELIASSISNVQARSDLAASRARIVAAADDERRRVVRDLHDGAQQRLVATTITLQLAQRALDNKPEEVPALMAEALDHAQRATAELRELAHGILPAVLTHGGLSAAVTALASRTPVPVEVDVTVGRLPTTVEATAYFVLAEALTNVAKHARATRAAVRAHVDDGMLRLQVSDDGVGGARPDGSGLVGLADRLAVLDGQLRIDSPAGGGTLVDASVPVSG